MYLSFIAILNVTLRCQNVAPKTYFAKFTIAWLHQFSPRRLLSWISPCCCVMGTKMDNLVLKYDANIAHFTVTLKPCYLTTIEVFTNLTELKKYLIGNSLYFCVSRPFETGVDRAITRRHHSDKIGRPVESLCSWLLEISTLGSVPCWGWFRDVEIWEILVNVMIRGVASFQTGRWNRNTNILRE